jgi:hypothetical protein
METWEEMRRRARTLEADVEQKLIAFNQLSISQVVCACECQACVSFLGFVCNCADAHACMATAPRRPGLQMENGQQTSRPSDREGDALLQNGETASNSMAAELDAYLSQVVGLSALSSTRVLPFPH